MRLVIHWLDDLRHEGAASLSWDAVRTNLGAWPYQAFLTLVITYALWPKLRHAVDGWVKGHLERHHDAIKATLAEHHESIRALLEAHEAKP